MVGFSTTNQGLFGLKRAIRNKSLDYSWNFFCAIRKSYDRGEPANKGWANASFLPCVFLTCELVNLDAPRAGDLQKNLPIQTQFGLHYFFLCSKSQPDGFEFP